MDLFSLKRGKIDKWYKQQLKTLDENFYSFINVKGEGGKTDLQAANAKSVELERAKEALKKEYIERLKAEGLKPRSDF